MTWDGDACHVAYGLVVVLSIMFHCYHIVRVMSCEIYVSSLHVSLHTEVRSAMAENTSIWEERPLKESYIQYAAQDVCFLYEAFHKMVSTGIDGCQRLLRIWML